MKRRANSPVSIIRLVTGLWAALLLADCSGDGSGDETIFVKLASDADCYGIAIEVDQSGLSSADLAAAAACTPDPALLALGCEADTSVSPTEFGLAVSGCFAPGDTPLFRCTVAKALAARFRETARLRCGCGCASDCPLNTGAMVCDGDGGACELAGAAIAAAGADIAAVTGAAGRTVGLVQATTTSSSTTQCGTCCDVAGIDTGVRLSDDVSVREMRFDLAMNIKGPSCPYYEGCSVASSFDGPSVVEFDGDSVHVCLSAKSAVAGPVHLLSCSLTSGGSDEFEISSIAALDEQLRVITPAPGIINDFGAP